jgi:hypothetical protein
MFVYLKNSSIFATAMAKNLAISRAWGDTQAANEGRL